MDGGKTAKAVLKKQLVIQDLNLLAVFVQNLSNDDPAIFAAGFTVKPTGKSAPQPVAVPAFRSLYFGANSGQIVVTVRAVAGGRSYFIRYAVMNGTTPGLWTTIPAASIQKAITISGLTPMTMYGFQVQALGVLNYSDWSTDRNDRLCLGRNSHNDVVRSLEGNLTNANRFDSPSQNRFRWRFRKSAEK